MTTLILKRASEFPPIRRTWGGCFDVLADGAVVVGRIMRAAPRLPPKKLR
jgi:hypothetical protein